MANARPTTEESKKLVDVFRLAVFALFFPIAVMALLVLPRTASSQSVGMQLPILENVQPSNLQPGSVWMGLPINRFVVFQNDTLTVPIKLSAGHGFRDDVMLSVELVLKTGQSAMAVAAIGSSHHWINGYTPNARMLKDGPVRSLSTTVTRLMSAFPITKYYRMEVSDEASVGTHLFKFLMENVGTQKILSEKYFTLAVHPGITFGEPSIEYAGGSVVVRVRDSQGNVMQADHVFVVTPSGERRVLDLAADGTYVGKIPVITPPTKLQFELKKKGFLPFTFSQ